MGSPVKKRSSALLPVWLCISVFIACLPSVAAAAEMPAEASEVASDDDMTLPLKSDKTLSFSIDEATWMSLAFARVRGARKPGKEQD